jgi:hypothetical protein
MEQKFTVYGGEIERAITAHTYEYAVLYQEQNVDEVVARLGIKIKKIQVNEKRVLLELDERYQVLKNFNVVYDSHFFEKLKELYAEFGKRFHQHAYDDEFRVLSFVGKGDKCKIDSFYLITVLSEFLAKHYGLYVEEVEVDHNYEDDEDEKNDAETGEVDEYAHYYHKSTNTIELILSDDVD